MDILSKVCSSCGLREYDRDNVHEMCEDYLNMLVAEHGYTCRIDTNTQTIAFDYATQQEVYLIEGDNFYEDTLDKILEDMDK